MSEIARETILAIAYFLQAGKENSQKQVLAYFERTAIGKPDLKCTQKVRLFSNGRVVKPVFHGT